MAETSGSQPAARLPRPTLAIVVVVGAIGLMLLGAWIWPRATATADLEGDAETVVPALASRLARTPPGERVAALLRHVADPSPALRYAAVDALGSQSGPEAAAAIEAAFADSSSTVRQRAVEVLAGVDRERGQRLLLAALQDEDEWIREAASTQLNLLARARPPRVDRRAVPILIRALNDREENVRILASSTLSKLTGRPWRMKKAIMSDVARDELQERWEAWWARVRNEWPSEHAAIPPVRPARADPAPDFGLADLDGRPITLRSQRGRVTLLNFWGSWCPPCRWEARGLAALDRRHRAQGLDIIGVALGERNGAAGLRAYCRDNRIEYRQALGTKEVQEAFGHIHEIPASVLIDRQGRIRYRWEGERSEHTFEPAIRRLLAEDG